MSTASVAELILSLKRDLWRDQRPFTPEMVSAQQQLFNTADPMKARMIILDWLAKHQPCLFGRFAAKMGALATCIIFEEELLNNPETWLADQIEEARRQWLADSFNGLRSGFVLLVVSRLIAESIPDRVLADLAKRFCSLYLVRSDVALDTIYHDETYLEAPGRTPRTWKWHAGVNYFCANADGRWWHDHRIPGGLAFSTNSVGHLVRSGILRKAQAQLAAALDVSDEVSDLKVLVDSLPKALRLAMQTIALAHDGCSGKATRLVPRSADTPTPPIPLTSYIAGMEHRFYEGYYHTDYTLPSEYFTPAEQRSPDLEPFKLDFSYLFDHKLDNPDHRSMALGLPIRLEQKEHDKKLNRAVGQVVEIASCPALVRAIST